MAETPNTNTPSAEPSEQSFYNVMPKAKLRSDLVVNMTKDVAHAGTGAPAAPSSAAPAAPKPPMSKSVKLALIGVLSALVLGAAGYFGYAWYEGKRDSNVLVPAPIAPPPPVTPPPPPTEPPPPPPDGLEVTTPSGWQEQHFGAALCGAEACADNGDPDTDGLTNKDEFSAQTDPKDNDSDNDGIADGDEVKVFGGNPLSIRTANDPQYSDADYVKGGYDVKVKDGELSAERLAEIKALVAQLGLHEPTLATLGVAVSLYREGGSGAIDNSPTAQLDRDAQRLATVKKIGVALYAFSQDAGYYPAVETFAEMVDVIKPYNPVATNFMDPINTPPYVYGYAVSPGGQDFTLTYYSETQKQLIKYTATNAARDAMLEQANINDDLRIRDLETLRSALLIYSAANSQGAEGLIFPKVETYKSDLIPEYLEEIPKDPKSGQDYEYAVSQDFKSFTIKAKLENPPAGSTGYLCTPDECDTY